MDYAALGDGFFDLKEYDKAEAYFAKAKLYDPELPINSYKLARIFTEKGEFPRALALTDGLLLQEAQNSHFLSLKAYILFKSEKHEEAQKYLEEVLKASPYSKDCLFNLGLLWYSGGDYAQAKIYLDRLIELSPSDDEALFLLAKSAFKTEDDKKGFELLEILIELKPAEPSYLRLKAQRRNELREYSLALLAYEELVKKDANRAEDWFELAKLAMMAAEDRERAAEALKKAFELGFSNNEVLEAFLTAIPEEDTAYLRAAIPKKDAEKEPSADAANATEPPAEPKLE